MASALPNNNPTNVKEWRPWHKCETTHRHPRPEDTSWQDETENHVKKVPRGCATNVRVPLEWRKIVFIVWFVVKKKGGTNTRWWPIPVGRWHDERIRPTRPKNRNPSLCPPRPRPPRPWWETNPPRCKANKHLFSMGWKHCLTNVPESLPLPWTNTTNNGARWPSWNCWSHGWPRPVSTKKDLSWQIYHCFVFPLKPKISEIFVKVQSRACNPRCTPLPLLKVLWVCRRRQVPVHPVPVHPVPVHPVPVHPVSVHLASVHPVSVHRDHQVRHLLRPATNITCCPMVAFVFVALNLTHVRSYPPKLSNLHFRPWLIWIVHPIC